MAMIELVYVSKAVKRMKDDELTQLLQAARSFNSQHGITGLLLYDGYGTFIQVLEGDEIAVKTLYQKIYDDPRHTNINRVGLHYIDQRSFPDWKMGYKTFDQSSLANASNFNQLVQGFSRQVVPDESVGFAIKMIRHFAQQA